MFRLDNILEEWARHYKVLAHESKVKRAGRMQTVESFYRIDTLSEDNDLVKKYATAHSPAMAYSTLIDAHVGKNGKCIEYRHVIYFLVKQAAQDDATECKYYGDMMVQDLLCFLQELRSAANSGKQKIETPYPFVITSDIKEGLRGLQTDDAEWGTIPMKWNGWWICGLELLQSVPRQLCVVNDRYQ